MSEGDAANKVRVIIKGRVQGVGFRYWIQDKARDLGLGGWVRNRPDGSVEALFAGPEAAVREMLAACWRGPNFSRVTTVTEQDAGDEDAPIAFHITR
jgi:acylphosphatase